MLMSKTTITLLIILLIFSGLLLSIMYIKQQNPIIESIERPIISRLEPARTTLSFETTQQVAKEGQTVTVAVIIHNPNPHPSIAQLEISYDPTVITIDAINPGTFFKRPMIALQEIDPVAGRISYALHCPNDQPSTDCINPESSTLAVITLSISPYAQQTTTELSFLPRSLIRTNEGRDLLKKTSSLQLMITNPLSPVASSSAFITPALNRPISATATP
jgi:hypothetical protein